MATLVLTKIDSERRTLGVSQNVEWATSEVGIHGDLVIGVGNICRLIETEQRPRVGIPLGNSCTLA